MKVFSYFSHRTSFHHYIDVEREALECEEKMDRERRAKK